MGRPIYAYELQDPDFSWLISNFQENFPHYTYIENGSLPVVFISPEGDEMIYESLPLPSPLDKDFPDHSGKE
jgi:hypothetical protein